MSLIRTNKIAATWENKHRLIPLVIVLALLTFLTLKIVFHSGGSNNIFFLYGISVTSILTLTFIVSLTKYKDPYQSASLMDIRWKNPLVSCIVAVFNEEAAIDECVISMTNQTYANKEVIIVDDCSTDGTANILDELAKKYPIKVIHLKRNVGKKSALTEGVYLSKGTIYAFTDSDSKWESSAVERIVKILEAYPEVGAVSGNTRVTNADANFITKVQDVWYQGQYGVRKAYESVFSSVSCVSGPLAVFRKEAVYNFMPAWENDSFLGQPFRFATDRTLTGIVLGSKYIGKKLIAKYPDEKFQSTIYPTQEWRVVYSQSALAWTIVPDTFKRMMKQQVRWKKSFIRNIFYTGGFYWRRPFGVALVYYMHVAFVLLGPFVAFRHMIYLPIHGNLYSMFLYLAGISFVGFMFGLAFKLENPNSHHWIYRPAMSLLSTLVLSWLIFYSAATIKQMKWSRD
jgi:cellulose synthase/poly-beta-1,6-N-acetylglucosamine synthase-like glycosyltransferase